MTKKQRNRIEDKLDWLIKNELEKNTNKTVNPDPVPPPRPKKDK